MEAKLAAPEEEVEAPTGPGVGVELAGLEVEALDALGLEAELAALEEEVEAPAGPEVGVELAGLEVVALYAHGLEAELANMSSSPTGCCAVQWAMWKGGGPYLP